MTSGQLFGLAFRIEHLNASGTKLGVLRAVTQITLNEALDQATELSFSIPAGDEQAAIITAGSYFDVYDDQDGYLGQFVFRQATVADQQGVATLQVQCYSTLIELARRTVQFHRQYNYHTVEEVVNDLVEIHPDWTCNAESGLGYTSVGYEGESILAAIDNLRSKFKLHFRHQPGFARRLEFGNLGADTGVRLTHRMGSPQYEFTIASHIGIVDTLQRRELGEEIVNRVIAVGGGQGVANFTMEGATYAGSYTLQSATNPDGTAYYYVEDTASIALYGVREYTVVFDDISPLSNTTTAKVNAANQLKAAAEAYLLKYKDPTVEYNVSCHSLPNALHIGDQVRLTYRGAVNGVGYLDIDADFYVLEMRKSRAANGNRSNQLVISSTLEPATDDIDVVVKTVKTVSARQLHAQPFPFRFEKTYYDSIQGGTTDHEGYFIGSPKFAKFNLDIDNTITGIDLVFIRLRTHPLFTYAYFQTFVDFVGSSFDQYGWFNVTLSDDYPMNLTLWINGEDVTEEYGGPWKELDSSQLDILLDITDSILNASGGIYQRHEIQLRAEEVEGDTIGETAVVLGYDSGSGGASANVSNGIAECTLIVQGSCQSIIST